MLLVSKEFVLILSLAERVERCHTDGKPMTERLTENFPQSSISIHTEL